MMTHYLFLTQEQRYILNVPEAEIEVIGSCIPVWMKDQNHVTKVAEEMFAKYRIRHCPEPEQQTINSDNEGFLIRLSPDMPKSLLDYHDEGKKWLSLTHKNVVTVDEKVIPIVHILNIEDMKVLEETLC